MCTHTDLSAACAVCSCREARGAAVRRSRHDQQRRDRHADGATRRRRIRRRRDGGRCSAMGAAGVKQQPHPCSPPHPHPHPHTHTQPHSHLPPHLRCTSLSTRCGALRVGTAALPRCGDRGRMCRCGWRAPVRQWGCKGWCDRGGRSRRGGGRMWGALDAALREWWPSRPLPAGQPTRTYVGKRVSARVRSWDLYQCVDLDERIIWVCGSHAESDGKGPFLLFSRFFLKP